MLLLNSRYQPPAAHLENWCDTLMGFNEMSPFCKKELDLWQEECVWPPEKTGGAEPDYAKIYKTIDTDP